VGLENYREVLTSPALRAAFGHVAQLLVFYALLPILLGLLIAALLSRKPIRGLTAYRTVLFLPQVVATVSAAVAWIWIYAYRGPLNTGLDAVGLGALRETWLGSSTFALPAVGLIGTWMTTGLCMVLFLAGMQRIPPELYDAAKVDGCGPVREFFAVTLPGLRSEMSVVLPLTIIAGLRTFDVVFVATAGGPGDATTTPSLVIFLNAFRYGQVGLASAIAVVLTIVIVLVTVALRRLSPEERT
jgi:raffinose/stachyose/melibiose transport system permease protein